MLLSGQDPEVTYLTAIGPGVAVEGRNNPVELLKETPVGIVNVPPAVPVIVGVGLEPFAQ